VKLQHQTEVGAKPEDVWAFLQDTPAVVQCMPGAELVDELGDDRYEGVLHVAIGPLKMNYAGKASVVERNAEEHRIVLDASGRDERGSGSVQAHVKLQVAPADSGSRIDVVSDDSRLYVRFAATGLKSHMFIAVGDDEYQNPNFADYIHDLDFESHVLHKWAEHTPNLSSELRVLNGGHDWNVWGPAFQEGAKYAFQYVARKVGKRA